MQEFDLDLDTDWITELIIQFFTMFLDIFVLIFNLTPFGSNSLGFEIWFLIMFTTGVMLGLRREQLYQLAKGKKTRRSRRSRR